MRLEAGLARASHDVRSLRLTSVHGVKFGEVMMAFHLSIPALPAGGFIPKKFTCDGEDLSPALQWSGAPSGTKSFALIVDDPDAPAGTWAHWVLFDLPAEIQKLNGRI